MACNKRCGELQERAEGCAAVLRCLENIPGIGHGIAAVYGCTQNKSHAERAALKATIGIITSVISCSAEAIDEMARKPSPKLFGGELTPRPDWMREFHRLTFNQIIMPGTHQSATYNMHAKLQQIPMTFGWARCQSLSITDQLRGGVRFLDLRLMDKDNDIWTHHNVVICVKLSEILTSVQQFVRENPSEVVGIHFSNDRKPLDWDKCDQMIREIIGTRIMYEPDRYKTLGEITGGGRNVAIFGFPAKPYSWNCLENRWPNKAWPDELQTDIKETANNRSSLNSFYYMFWYKAECTPNTPMVVRHFGGISGLCARPCAKEKFDFLEDMAASANHKVHEYLESVDKLPFNIISTDFIPDAIIERVINFNKFGVSGSPQAAPQAMAAQTAASAPERAQRTLPENGGRSQQTASNSSLPEVQTQSPVITQQPVVREMWETNV